MGQTTNYEPNQKEQREQRKHQPDKKDIMLGLIEILYKSNNINEATYINVKRVIKQEA